VSLISPPLSPQVNPSSILEVTTMISISGTIGAALSAAALSFLGLLITKQSKISEFRQQWIDALRQEVASLISNAFTIFESDSSDPNQSYAELHRLTSLIALRLNPGEEQSKALLAAVNGLRDELHSSTTFTAVQSKVQILISATQAVLKMEWQRVKSGELFYRWVFRIAVGGTGVFLVVWLAQHHSWLGFLLRFFHTQN
jgi:hypothetical protein